MNRILSSIQSRSRLDLCTRRLVGVSVQVSPGVYRGGESEDCVQGTFDVPSAFCSVKSTVPFIGG